MKIFTILGLMKLLTKKIVIILIIFIITVSLGYAIFDSVRDYWGNIKIEKWKRETACWGLSFYYYRNQEEINRTINEYKKDIRALESEMPSIIERVNEESYIINKAIEIEAQAEGWKFISQTEECAMQKLNNSATPFLSTINYIFQDPQNNNIYHSLTKSFIYDSNYSGWVPLSSDLKEINEAGPIRYKILGSWRLWQGDWGIPFFKNSTTTPEIIIPWEN